MDCSPPGSSVHEIFQARILEWVAISFSRGSSQLGIEPGSPALQILYQLSYKGSPEYTEWYKIGLNDPDNHDGVITHLQSDILKCEVKWALESITTNKASGSDGITNELFQIIKGDAVKVCTQQPNKFGKLSRRHRTGRGQFSFQPQKKGNVKECSNYRTVALISHASKVMLKILQARLQ